VTQRLLERRVAALPVVDDEGRLVGIVSELDMLRLRVPPDPSRAPVPAVAAGRAGAAHGGRGDDPRGLRAAALRRCRRVRVADARVGVKSVPVVQGELLVGIVGRRDLLRLLARDDEAIRAEIEELLGSDGVLSGWRAEVDDGEVTLTGSGAPDSADAAQRLVRSVPGVVRTHVRGD
jgi:CBS domain-containing protein